MHNQLGYIFSLTGSAEIKHECFEEPTLAVDACPGHIMYKNTSLFSISRMKHW